MKTLKHKEEKMGSRLFTLVKSGNIREVSMIFFRCDGCGEPINKSCSDAAYT